MLWSIFRGGLSFWQILFMFLSYAVLILIMMPVHEAAHAFAAHKLGDDTAKWNGRLTLNPLAHLDPIGSLMILAFGIGYAKPVPVNPYNFRKCSRKTGMALTALAGPLSNLLMAAISMGIFRLIYTFTTSYTVLMYANLVLLNVFVPINIGLAVFNLLPIPPLDGSRIFGAILPDKWTAWVDQHFQIVQLALLLLIFTGALDVPLNFLRSAVGNLLCRIFFLPALF